MGGDMILATLKPALECNRNRYGWGERACHCGMLTEICTLDCGTMNFAEADYVMTNTGMLRAMAKMMTVWVSALRLKPMQVIYGLQTAC